MGEDGSVYQAAANSGRLKCLRLATNSVRYRWQSSPGGSARPDHTELSPRIISSSESGVSPRPKRQSKRAVHSGGTIDTLGYGSDFTSMQERMRGPSLSSVGCSR